MSPKIDISCFRLRAINFDNARELNSVFELVNQNLSESESSDFKSRFSDFEDDNNKIVSVLVCYDDEPIAHISYEFNDTAKEVIFIAPVIDRNFEHLRHFVNAMIWRTLTKVSKRQGWKQIKYSTMFYGDIPTIDCIEFRAIVADILPGSAAASLRNQIEVVHGDVEVVNVAENAYGQLLLNLP